MKKNICEDCGPLPQSHVLKYIDSILERTFPHTSSKLSFIIENAFERTLLFLGLLKKMPYSHLPDISFRSSVFIEEGVKSGFSFWTIFGPRGPTGRFQMKKGGKTYSFEGLPRAEFLNTKESDVIDDKSKVKQMLIHNELPTPQGKCFGLFSFKRAIAYGCILGFPLVVKPRSGSISRHVFLNIQNKDELVSALKKTLSYEPWIIIEKFLSPMKTYRATVVDFSRIAVVERVPAHIIGDGTHTIQELIDIKNTDPKRGFPKQKNTTLYKIVINRTTDLLLKKSGYSFDDIPENGKIVFLQEKVILDLGADLFEVTDKVHQDNFRLFEKTSRLFGARLIGIDFLAGDISKSWKEQHSAIVELNSLPYIDMHHFPTSGAPVCVGKYICDLVEKYY